MKIKRKYKYLAFILILSLIFPFFPSVHVSADGLAFLPDFPFEQDSYYNVNNGSFALWQIHNSNYLTYVQTFTPNNISYPNPIIIFNKTWLASNYTYYLDYTYIIDSWDITGLHSDGFSGTQNIRVPNPNEDFVSDNVVYATLLYTTDNIIWRNGSDVGVYAYTNFYPDGYADPTPTPAPTPSYGELPTFTINSTTEYLDECTLVVKCTTSGTLGGYTYSEGHYYASGSSYMNNPWYYYFIQSPHSSQFLYGGCMPHRIQANGNFDMIFSSGIYSPRVFSIGYDLENNIITSGININAIPKCDLGVNSSGYHCYSNYFPIEGINAWFDGSNYINIVDSARFELIACNYGSYRGNGELVPSTPTPTAIPTAIPQPTTNPNPTATPEPDVKVVQPSDHWWDGLVKPIQYIFVPSSDKMMRTYNSFADKFGVQKPTKFEFSVDSLVRPNNVTWKFKHVSLDGSNNTETEITLIDFEMVDDWLETSAGRMIIRIVRATFGLLMFGYLMYIFRKHIATINYTDAETLKDISKNNDGGGEDD